MKSNIKKHQDDWSVLKYLFLSLVALIMGGRIQTLPSGQIRISFFKWQYFLLSIFITTFCFLILINKTSFNLLQWNKIDINDEEYIFLPFTSRKLSTKFNQVIHNQPTSHSPQLYYPRNCPQVYQPQYASCAKAVPSFIFAGSEFSGASSVFQKLIQHPQVYTSVDNSNPKNSKHIFDSEEFDEATAFDRYIAQFPFLSTKEISNKQHWIVGENAPHYLYKSHLTAKRIKDVLPHVKLIFFLREPIARAYSQYLFEKPEIRDTKLSFEELIDLELPILRRCGHTSTQTGWEGFVTCHQGSEIRASWKVSNGTNVFNSLAKGMYYPALIPFLQSFPPSHLLIIRTEDLLAQPTFVFQKLARFLEINPNFFLEEPELLTEGLLSSEELKLSTQYRLQRVYRLLNRKLLELFNQTTIQFKEWIYDVDRG